MFIKEIYNKIVYNKTADRLGPDLPVNHWKLYFKKSMINLCKKKFKKFSKTSDLRPGSYIVGCSKIEIGKRVVIRPSCMFFGESNSLNTSIIIEDNVMMGAGVHIYINNHKFEKSVIPFIDQGYFPDKAVVVKKGSWLGANTILLPGVTIGENSVIGAGSVVTKSIPGNVVAAGNPCKVLKNIV
jgi:acetyltransferase-like isoleucine patch superfamily enzyme